MTGCCCFPFFFKKRPSAHADGGLTQPLRDDPEADEPGALPRPPSLDPWTKRGMQKAARVLEEMLSTERAYVNDLRALSSHFLAPPSGAKLPLGPLGVELASWVASLLRVHQELLKQLEQIGQSDTTQAVSGVARTFSTMTPFLRVYSSYCAGTERALQLAASIRGPQLTEIETQSGQSFDSLLIKPVQRLCKYPLFFADLVQVPYSRGGGGRLRRAPQALPAAIRHVARCCSPCLPPTAAQALPTGSPVAPALARVAATIKEVNLDVNVKVRGVEESARLLQLHVELGGVPEGLVAPARRLLMQASRAESNRARLSSAGSNHAGLGSAGSNHAGLSSAGSNHAGLSSAEPG